VIPHQLEDAKVFNLVKREDIRVMPLDVIGDRFDPAATAEMLDVPTQYP
jgi:hypothetical protein